MVLNTGFSCADNSRKLQGPAFRRSGLAEVSTCNIIVACTKKRGVSTRIVDVQAGTHCGEAAIITTGCIITRISVEGTLSIFARDIA